MNRQASGACAFTGRVALVAALVIGIMGLALGLGACSVSDSVIGTTETAAPSTTTTAAVNTSDSGSTATTATKVIEGGKTVDEYAADIPDLQQAVDANPTDLTALQNLAVAQYNSRQYDKAIATYRKMLQIEDDPTVHNNYANVLRDESKFLEAKAEYRKAIAGDPALAVAYINLASVYALEGNITEAQKVLDQGIAHTVGDDKQRVQNYKTTLGKAK